MPKIRDCRYSLYNEDCFATFARLRPGSIDMVMVDPPYGTTECKWDTAIPLEAMWAELKRIVKLSGVIVFMAGQPYSSTLVCSNLSMFRYEWVWVKTKITGVFNAKKMPVRKHELVLV